MLWLEQKYLMLAASRLDRFKVQTNSPFVANFRCPYCGDSAKSKRRARGFVYERDGGLKFYCHNCGQGTNLPGLLRHVDETLFDDFILERITNDRQDAPREYTPQPKPVTRFVKGWRKGLRPLVDLPTIHAARRFIADRRIPEAWWDHLWYTEEFKAWTNTIVPHKFDDDRDEPRVVISFQQATGELLGFQGRCLPGSRSIRYMTIRVQEDLPAVFGLDRYDPTQNGYALEGPFDSMFLPNALAVASSAISSVLSRVISNRNVTVVFDNEPRNPQIIRRMWQAVQAGFPICVWPDWVPGKDVNDMVLRTNNSPELVKAVIDEYTFSDPLRAELEIRRWKRTDEVRELA